MERSIRLDTMHVHTRNFNLEASVFRLKLAISPSHRMLSKRQVTKWERGCAVRLTSFLLRQWQQLYCKFHILYQWWGVSRWRFRRIWCYNRDWKGRNGESFIFRPLSISILFIRPRVLHPRGLIQNPPTRMDVNQWYVYDRLTLWWFWRTLHTGPVSESFLSRFFAFS